MYTYFKFYLLLFNCTCFDFERVLTKNHKHRHTHTHMFVCVYRQISEASWIIIFSVVSQWFHGTISTIVRCCQFKTPTIEKKKNITTNLILLHF